MLSSYVNKVLNSVIQAEMRHFPIEILDPVYINDVLTRIEENLPYDTTLAVDFKNSGLLELYKNTECSIVSDTISMIVSCSLDLIKRSGRVQLFEVLSIPYPTNDTNLFHSLIPTSPYFGIDQEEKNLFFAK